MRLYIITIEFHKIMIYKCKRKSNFIYLKCNYIRIGKNYFLNFLICYCYCHLGDKKWLVVITRYSLLVTQFWKVTRYCYIKILKKVDTFHYFFCIMLQKTGYLSILMKLGSFDAFLHMCESDKKINFAFLRESKY